MKEIHWKGKTGKPLLVADKYNWLAFDEDGEAYVYVYEPEPGWGEWWGMSMAEWKYLGHDITPPEPGAWYDQKYWIGDK